MSEILDDANIDLGSEVIAGTLTDLASLGVKQSVSADFSERCLDAACWRLRGLGLNEAEIVASRLVGAEVALDCFEMQREIALQGEFCD